MKPLRMLILGDSIAAGRLPHTQIDAGIGETLHMPPEMRMAVSGSTAEDWADGPLQGRFMECLLREFDVAVLSLLANSAFKALGNDGVVTEAEKIAALSSFGYVVRAVRDFSPRPVIVMLYQDPYFGARPDIAAAVEQLDAAIVAACPPGTEILDLRQILKPEHYDGQDIHPSQDGYDLIAAEILNRLNKGTPS